MDSKMNNLGTKKKKRKIQTSISSFLVTFKHISTCSGSITSLPTESTITISKISEITLSGSPIVAKSKVKMIRKLF